MLHQERDDVAAFTAPKAVAGEDVVLEDERVTVLDLGAEDLLDAVGRLDGVNHPARTGENLSRAGELRRCCTEKEEVLRQVLGDQVDAEERGRLAAREALPHLRS